MIYNKEIVKKLIEEFLNNGSELQVTNHFFGLYKKDEDFRKFIDDPFITFGNSLAQKLYNIYYDITEWPMCAYENCNNRVKFQYFNKGYRNTCSKWCTNYVKYGCKSTFGTKEQHEKAQQTLLEKTGYKSGAANPETRAKMVATMKEKYGDVFQKTEEYKEKCKSTNLMKYGAEHFMSTKEGIEKAHNTQKMKYNGLLYQQTEEFKKLASKQYLEKNKKEKTAKGRRDSYYNKFKNLANEKGYDLLFSMDEYSAKYDHEQHKWIKYPLKCKVCGYEFEIALGNIERDGINCPNCCKKSKSQVQHRMLDFLKSKYQNLTFIEDESRILDNKKQIDIYCEEKKFGIEYNGNCWHAQKFNNKGKEYHLEKFNQYEKHNVNVLSFWSDEFDRKSEFIYEMIDLFLSNEKLEVYEDITYKFTDTLGDELMKEFKNRCLYEISEKDTFIIVKSHDEVLAILKCKNFIINEIVFMKKYDFSHTFDRFNGILKFKLDNRLMPYYRLFFNEKIHQIENEEPRFYIFSKKQRSILKNDISKVDFTKEDIIWNYGESIFQLN